jgi:predicted Zn-dependent protease
VQLIVITLVRSSLRPKAEVIHFLRRESTALVLLRMTNMKRILRRFLVANTVGLLVLSTARISQAQSTWTPPPARTAKTPLAPKPHAGHNIFKGEAETWLADAIEGECFSPSPIRDEVVGDYVSRVGNYVARYSTAPAKEYRFVVTQDSGPDAWSTCGGRIFITVGLLRLIETEDQLAGILAHELAHDAFGHTTKTVTRQLFWMTGIKKVDDADDVEKALERLHDEYKKQPVAQLGDTVLGFSRFDELEADRAAFYNMYKAGYNPHGLSDVLKVIAGKMKEEQGKKTYWRDEFLMLLFANHPPDTQRFLALSWERNFVKMPPRDSQYNSPAFNEMKKRLADE